jgi:putative transposase
MKPGVFSQLYVHLIFTPKYRERLLIKEIRPELFSYMCGIITNRKHKSIIINGVLDHVHILAGLNTDDKISDLVKNIKDSSSTFLNEKRFFHGNFHWQEGYGAFSYGKSQLDSIYQYISNQEAHHKRGTFREEYVGFLKKFEIAFDEKYLFEFFD